jgi:hypothetical protein
MTKTELKDEIQAITKDILNILNTDSKKNDFTRYLIETTGNENHKYTLNFIKSCATNKDYKFNELTKELLRNHYNSVCKYYKFLNSYLNR